MDQDYWLKVIRIGTKNTVNRITRCSQIMGRAQEETLSAAQIFYPCMQAADIFHLEVDIAQLGLDQRKVNMLAREVAPKLGYKKPIAIHHHMLMGLNKPKEGLSGIESAIAKKMSKSNPDSAIFMTDTSKEIKRKFNKAYCPEGEVENNPVLEYCKYIIFEKTNSFKVERPEKFGGDITYNSYKDLEEDFVNKKLHPMDLKQTAAKYINNFLEPVRKHFEENQYAKELYNKVKNM
jgi:tyrosyl-tRNA synthetase